MKKHEIEDEAFHKYKIPSNMFAPYTGTYTVVHAISKAAYILDNVYRNAGDETARDILRLMLDYVTAEN